MNTIETKGQEGAEDGAEELEEGADEGAGEGEGADEGAGEGNGEGEGNGKKKTTESDADRLSRLQRQTNQARQKVGLEKIDFDGKKTTTKKVVKNSDKPTELDYAQKAFLKSSGLNTQDEMQAAFDAAQSSGKTLESVLESNWFKEDLQKIRSKAAVPNGKNRSGNPTASDTVEYWLEKDELPPANNPELRKKYVNAKAAKEGKANPFTKTPVVK